MAKLYAEVTSDKGGRVVGKGGEIYTTAIFKRGNKTIFTCVFDGNQAQLNTIDKNGVIEKGQLFWCSDTHKLT